MENLTTKNLFEKFDLKPSFELDVDELEAKYLAFQQQFHPDKLIGKSKEEQIDLEHNSFLINEAFAILKNPLRRAIYLLKLHGINIDDESCPVKPDQETLIKTLELREFIFENRDIEKLTNLRQALQKESKEILRKAKNHFENQDYKNCALELIKAKYLEKSQEEIKKIIVG